MTCGGCERPTSTGIYLCHACTHSLERDLQDVELTVESLWTTATKRDVGSGSVGSSGHSTPGDPSNSSAYDTGRTLNVILAGWADTLGYTEPHAVRAAHLLLTHIRDIREQDWAADLKRELREVMWQCDTVTDRGGRRVFAGICPTETETGDCGTPVYTPEGKTEAKCRQCGASWDVADWRERAMLAAGPATGTAVELTRILSDPTRALVFPQNKVAVWVSRKTLRPMGYRADGRAVYQVRKVRRLWERSILESAARAERMAAAKPARERAEAEELRGRIAA